MKKTAQTEGIDLVRFKATDGVELLGWLSEQQGKKVVIHIHGMSGNGYENAFLDHMRSAFSEKGVSFFTINTRGKGVMSDFPHGKRRKIGGSCYEIFEESAHDIAGAIELMVSRGKTEIILQGHSLGCTKVVNYLLQDEVSKSVTKVVLLAPTDMASWAANDPDHQQYLEKSQELMDAGKNLELVGFSCWLNNTPLSAQTYPTICEVGSSADIYGEREDGALLGRIDLPMLIPYGTDDIGIVKIDGSMEVFEERLGAIKHENTSLHVIDGADHGCVGYEAEVARVVAEFL